MPCRRFITGLLALLLLCLLMASESVRGDGPCLVPARAYFQTGEFLDLGDGDAHLAISIGSPRPVITFTFLHGSAQQDIMTAINAFTAITFVTAEVAPGNKERVMLEAAHEHADEPVAAVQKSFDEPHLYECATGGEALFDVHAEPTPAHPADLTCSGTVGVDDLLILIDLWGPCDWQSDADCPADLNGDGVVNVQDLLLLIDAWM